MHAEISHTPSSLRKYYWSEKGRQTVSKILRKECYDCRRWKSKSFELPIMPSLPTERVIPLRNFQHRGPDYIEPIDADNSTYKKVIIFKAEIALFPCFTTRAIHLELAEDLTTPTLEHIIQRFIAVKGKPESITSNNAPQFIALAKNYNIKWKLIAAPQKKGAYKRYKSKKDFEKGYT